MREKKLLFPKNRVTYFFTIVIFSYHMRGGCCIVLLSLLHFVLLFNFYVIYIATLLLVA